MLMGKLKNLGPSVVLLKPRLGAAVGDAKAQDRERGDRNKARAWYGTKRWADLKRSVFVRDNYTCQRTGELCSGRYPAPNSPVANHKVPHRGDPTLFWDERNIETVTKAVHDKLIQAEEQAIPTGRWD
jgi:5-methylcytosine-specific restriction protein A